MQFDWRAFSGPALAAATALIAVFADRAQIGVPDPALLLLICITALAGSLSGLASGMISSAIAIAASTLLLLHHHTTPADLARLSMLALAATATAVITGLLRKRLVDALARERAHHTTAERLAAALDQSEIGIVLLDADTRAEFINRAFRDYFALSDAKAASKPPFIALLYHGRDTGAWEMPEEEFADFIAQRTKMMRAGDQTPININLKDGKVLRFSCTALPDGGRMLSYTPVTDLVRHTDSPADADYYQSLRGGGNRGLIHYLRAAE